MIVGKANKLKLARALKPHSPSVTPKKFYEITGLGRMEALRMKSNTDNLIVVDETPGSYLIEDLCEEQAEGLLDKEKILNLVFKSLKKQVETEGACPPIISKEHWDIEIEDAVEKGFLKEVTK